MNHGRFTGEYESVELDEQALQELLIKA